MASHEDTDQRSSKTTSETIAEVRKLAEADSLRSNRRFCKEDVNG